MGLPLAPITDGELERMAIFPLAGVVHFPHASLPLHVFEPRYRQLIEHCLAVRMPLAIWPLDPNAPETPFGPALRPVATAGRIAAHEKLRDGRYNVVVHGLERVRLVREMPSDLLYRNVEVARLPLPKHREPGLDARIAMLRDLVHSLASVAPQESQVLTRVIQDHLDDPGELSDLLCSALDDPPSELLRLLECDSLVKRLAHVTDRLALLLLRRDPGPSRDDDAPQRH